MRCGRCTWLRRWPTSPLELDDEALKRACETLWRDVTTAQMYVTGGLGPEGNQRGLHRALRSAERNRLCRDLRLGRPRLLGAADAASRSRRRYADVMERALYNGALSGLSREGTHYFYANPLESRGQHKRWAWHLCPCCTMNVSRLVASIGGYAISTSEDGVAFHLYGGVRDERRRSAASKVALRETSDYPWSGDIRIEVDPEAPAAFDLKLRIPGWAKDATAAVNGEPMPLAIERGLCDDPSALEPRRRRDARSADAARAPLCPSKRAHGRRPRRAEARPADLLRRGGRQFRRAGPDARRCRAARRLEAKWRADLFGGVVTLEAPAKRLVPGDARRRALFDDAAADQRRQADRDPLLSLGQSPARLDAGVDRRRRRMKHIPAGLDPQSARAGARR